MPIHRRVLYTRAGDVPGPLRTKVSHSWRKNPDQSSNRADRGDGQAIYQAARARAHVGKRLGRWVGYIPVGNPATWLMVICSQGQNMNLPRIRNQPKGPGQGTVYQVTPLMAGHSFGTPAKVIAGH
jgi:hypothetical protein